MMYQSGLLWSPFFYVSQIQHCGVPYSGSSHGTNSVSQFNISTTTLPPCEFRQNANDSIMDAATCRPNTINLNQINAYSNNQVVNFKAANYAQILGSEIGMRT